MSTQITEEAFSLTACSFSARQCGIIQTSTGEKTTKLCHLQETNMEYNTIHCSRPQTVPYLQLPPPRRGTYTLELSRNKVSLSLMVLCALHVYRPCMHWTYCSHPALHIQLLHSPCKCYREKWSNTSLVVIIIHLLVLPETAVTIREYSFSKSQSVSPILTCYI